MVNRPKSDLEMEEVFLPVLASSSSTAAVPTDLDHKKLPPENSGLNLKVSSPEEPQEVVRLQLYKRRWAGLVIIFILDVLNSMNAFWFTSIADEASERFEVSATRISWLVNVCNLVSLLTYPLVPTLCHRFLPRNLCIYASVVSLAAGWIRYTGCVAPAFSAEGDRSKGWGLVLFSQVLFGLVGPFTLGIGSKYSELWFDVKERTFGTMLLSIGAPLGTAISQVIAPVLCVSAKDIPYSVLIMASINSLVILSFLVPSKPLTPPTFAATAPPATFVETARLYLSDLKIPFLPSTGKPSTISKRERIDLWLLTFVFGVLTATITAFSSEINSIFIPYGYSSSAAGNIAAIVVSGLIGALISAPIIDRFLVGKMAIVAKAFTTVVAFGFFGLVWAIKPNNVTAVVALFCLMGASSFSLLAIGLELGAEVTRQPDTSASAFYWVSGLFTFIFINIMNALRAGPNANPPHHMKHGLIFEVAMNFIAMALVYLVRGTQSRTVVDREKKNETTCAKSTPAPVEANEKKRSFFRFKVRAG